MSSGQLVSSGGLESLQRAFEDMVRDAPYIAATAVITKKLKAKGVLLSESEEASLLKRLKSGSLKKLSLARDPCEMRSVEVSITPEDIAEIEKKVENFKAALPELVDNQANYAADLILKSLRKRWPKEQYLQQKEIKAFRQRLFFRWAPALGGLRMVLTMAREIGATVRRQTLSKSSNSAPHLVEVQTRLHARACQVTEEVLCLLESGFGEGALARWRTLHEISVISDVILEGAEETAKRYVDHHSIEALRAAEEYQRLHKRLKYRPISAAKLAMMRQNASKNISTYGKQFASQYGWSADLLKMQRPTFVDLEKRAHSDHYRSHYKWASDGVHAGPKAIFKPELKIGKQKIILAGPSNGGLADPGHATAISLGRVTANVAMLNPILDIDVSIRILAILIDEVGEKFLSCHEDLEADEKAHAND